MPACLAAASSCTRLSTSRADCMLLLLTCRSENTTQLRTADRPGWSGAGANRELLLWLLRVWVLLLVLWPCLVLLRLLVVAAGVCC